jgi:hypothetical protein
MLDSSEHKINGPAPADVRPLLAQVLQDVSAVAAGVLQGVS